MAATECGLMNRTSCDYRTRLMLRSLLICCCGLLWLLSARPSVQAAAPASRGKLDIVAIYFPGFHHDAHYDSWFSEGWNEWRLLEDAPTRFPGQQFLRPQWGPFDEADPVWMDRQIDLAVEHGITVFLFDWYWYSGVKILNRPLEEGLAKATHRQKIKYALMWANHDWRNVFPAPLKGPETVWLPSRITPADFERVMAHCIQNHFRQKNYWRVDGAAYFSIFDSDSFVRQLGGPEKARQVTDRARQQVEAAGAGKLHLAGFAWDPGAAAKLKEAGFDSVTTYNVTVSSKASLPDHPLDDYADLMARHEEFWKGMDTGLLPYAPVVTLGWDPSPRWVKETPFPPSAARGYPYTTIVTNNTPEQFGELCRRAKRQYETSRLRPPGIVINAWNEWTEGSALLPEQLYGTRFLEELRKAFVDK
jgi:hypothetical protein